MINYDKKTTGLMNNILKLHREGLSIHKITKQLRTTYKRFKEFYETDILFREKFDEITLIKEMEDIDTVYDKMMELITEEGNDKLIKFFLENKGKVKGFKSEEIKDIKVSEIKITHVTKKIDEE